MAHISWRHSGALLAGLLLLTFPFAIPADERSVTEASDFQTIQKDMQDRKLPLLLEFRADYCGYCRQLEATYLSHMVKSGDYDNKILIRSFTLGKSDSITDFNGDKTDADSFAAKYHALVTPTLVFLDSNGQQVAEALQGYNSPDFYGAYLENAIATAQKAVQGQKETGLTQATKE